MNENHIFQEANLQTCKWMRPLPLIQFYIKQK